MDYIREELLRQRAALARLLLGRSGEELSAAEEHAEKAPFAQSVEDEFLGMDQDWSADQEARWIEKRRGQTVESVSSAAAAGTAAERLLTVGRSGGQELTATEERTVTETVWAATGRAGGARELSRAFQRDARRYDGGFALY